jgi:transposase-like protein
MDPQQAFCPNLDCPARGQPGQGHIGIHSQHQQRYICNVCGRTFSARDGTVFYRCRIAADRITLVITLVAHGCPIPAIVAAFGFQARTVRRWVARAGQHCAVLHQQQIVQPRDLGQVQADELRVKTQRGVLWMAMAVMVPTRLWLGGVISPHRDKHLIRQLAAVIRASALPCPLLLAVDGLSSYSEAFRKAFRSPERSGKRGAPRKVPWTDLVIGQVVKQYCRRRVGGVTRRLAAGTPRLLTRLLRQTQGEGVLNTAYIERLNATFRARLAVLTRRTRGLARRQAWLQAGMYLVGTVYNFCTEHASLTLDDGTHRTPAMAAGITDHRWSVAELLWHRVPPPRWTPPKRRGRRSKELQQLIDRWAT